jgi:hypothetical protein
MVRPLGMEFVQKYLKICILLSMNTQSFHYGKQSVNADLGNKQL